LILKNEYLQDIPNDFPLFNESNDFLSEFISQEDFKQYFAELYNDQDQLNFLFSHLVRFFQAANFNGAYLLVQDLRSLNIKIK